MSALSSGRSTRLGLDVTVFHAGSARGERAIDVDQTNELVVVGETAVVKWMLHPAAGEQQGPRRLTTLAEAGFDGVPRTWGLVRAAGGRRARADRDGLGLPARRRGRLGLGRPRCPGGRARRGATSTTASSPCARSPDWSPACTWPWPRQASTGRPPRTPLPGWPVRRPISRRPDWLRTSRRRCVLASPRSADAPAPRRSTCTATCTSGRSWRSGEPRRYSVIDFDGNPTQDERERLRRQPAARDVAGMLASWDHVGRVVLHRTEGLDEAAVAARPALDRPRPGGVPRDVPQVLATAGRSSLLDESLLLAMQVQQECREYVYADRYLPHWRYVPDAALPALLSRAPAETETT